MSRSRRKRPFRGITSATSEKQDKRLANRTLRRRIKEILSLDVEVEVLPELRDVSDPWVMDKDGKIRFDPDRYPKEMRE